MRIKFNKVQQKFFYFLLFLIFPGYFFSQQKSGDFLATYSVNGRIQADYEFHRREKKGEILQGFEFRRVYLSVKGKIHPRVGYKIEVNIAGGEMVFNDMYIKFHGGKWGDFGIGSMVEPAGLNISTSSKYITFNERSMLTSLQNHRWGAGLHYENFHLLNGFAGFQVALTNNGRPDGGFIDKNVEKGQNFVVRLMATPVKKPKKGQLMHLGVNYASRPEKDLTFKPENHLGDKYTYKFPDAVRRFETGFEWAGVYRNFSLQWEWKRQIHTNRLDKRYFITGYYGFVSYFLTGESRPYKKGAFGRVSPRRDVFHGGLGAIELVARFSNMNASNDVRDVNPLMPGRISNWTLGLNWYLSSHVAFKYNFNITDDQQTALGKLYAHLVRIQIDF